MGVLSRPFNKVEWVKRIRAVQDPAGPVLMGRRILRGITTRVRLNRPRGFDLVHATKMCLIQNSRHLVRHTPTLIWFAIANTKSNLRVEYLFNILSAQAVLWRRLNPSMNFLNAYVGVPDFNRDKALVTKMAVRYIYKKAFDVLELDYKILTRCEAGLRCYRPSKFGTQHLYRLWSVSKFRALCTTEVPRTVYGYIRKISTQTLKIWRSRRALVDCYTKHINALELHTKLFGSEATRRAVNYEYVFRGLWKKSLALKP